MHIGSEVTLQTGHKAYLSEDATWYETNDFCKEAGVRLCTEDELCNRRTGMHIMDDQNLTEDDRFNRWGRPHTPSRTQEVLLGAAPGPEQFLTHVCVRACVGGQPSAPLHGSEHVWLELRNCGLTRWPVSI